MRTITYDFGNLADWISAIGTIGALFYAIYLATKDSRIKLSITVINDKFRYESNGVKPNTYDICVVNVRPRTVHIRALGFYVGNKFKKNRITRMTDSENILLGSIGFGEMKTETITFNIQRQCEALGTRRNKRSKFYVGFEDITGKIYYKKFTP
ncbi:hypothetical protein MKY88_17280 [Lysinibacillus sp. FSL R7-0073]|uniref:hypothetical protein n=1 Tax=Lysinibacillus sp. FSL R7-0073 TaxID=2921669 RepID=UPI0030F8E79B